MDLGTIAVIALIGGLAGGAVGAALVGTVEGILRRAQPGREWRFISDVERAMPTSARPRPAVPFEGLDPDSRKVMTLARQEAIQSGHSYIGSENLAMALRLFSTPTLGKIWDQLAIDPETLRRRIEAAVPPTLGTMPTEGTSTPRVIRIIFLASAIAAERNRYETPPEFLLLALADEGGGAGAHVLASLGATGQRIRELVDGAKSLPPK